VGKETDLPKSTRRGTGSRLASDIMGKSEKWGQGHTVSGGGKIMREISPVDRPPTPRLGKSPNRNNIFERMLWALNGFRFWRRIVIFSQPKPKNIFIMRKKDFCFIARRTPDLPSGMRAPARACFHSRFYREGNQFVAHGER